MDMQEFMKGSFYTFAEWVARLMYVNLLWFVFTFLGLGIFGFFPATAALFYVSRRWIMGEENLSVLPTFWNFYKTRFIKANLLGVMLITLAFLLYSSFNFYIEHTGFIYYLITLVIILFILMYLITTLFIFPVFVYYDLDNIKLIKNAFFIAMGFIHKVLLMILGLILFTVAFMFLPALFIFFIVSGPAYIIMWIAYNTFIQIEEKYPEDNNKEEQVEENKEE